MFCRARFRELKLRERLDNIRITETMNHLEFRGLKSPRYYFIRILQGKLFITLIFMTFNHF